MGSDSYWWWLGSLSVDNRSVSTSLLVILGIARCLPSCLLLRGSYRSLSSPLLLLLMLLGVFKTFNGSRLVCFGFCCCWWLSPHHSHYCHFIIINVIFFQRPWKPLSSHHIAPGDRRSSDPPSDGYNSQCESILAKKKHIELHNFPLIEAIFDPLCHG